MNTTLQTLSAKSVVTFLPQECVKTLIDGKVKRVYVVQTFATRIYRGRTIESSCFLGVYSTKEKAQQRSSHVSADTTVITTEVILDPYLPQHVYILDPDAIPVYVTNNLGQLEAIAKLRTANPEFEPFELDQDYN
jgi:hypothetical protein